MGITSSKEESGLEREPSELVTGHETLRSEVSVSRGQD